MERILSVRYRVARVTSALLPDYAVMLYAGLHHPGRFVAFLLWVAEGVAAHMILTLALYPLLLWIRRQLTPGERCRLVELRDRMFPPLDPAEGDEDEDNLDDNQLGED